MEAPSEFRLNSSVDRQCYSSTAESVEGRRTSEAVKILDDLLVSTCSPYLLF